jgi:hypothetical protein
VDASPRPNLEYLDTTVPSNFYTTYCNNPMEEDGPFYAWTSAMATLKTSKHNSHLKPNLYEKTLASRMSRLWKRASNATKYPIITILTLSPTTYYQLKQDLHITTQTSFEQ